MFAEVVPVSREINDRLACFPLVKRFAMLGFELCELSVLISLGRPPDTYTEDLALFENAGALAVG